MAATVERLALIQKQLFAGNDDVAIYFFEVCARVSECGGVAGVFGETMPSWSLERPSKGTNSIRALGPSVAPPTPHAHLRFLCQTRPSSTRPHIID